jgi:hypothetical protein
MRVRASLRVYCDAEEITSMKNLRGLAAALCLAVLTAWAAAVPAHAAPVHLVCNRWDQYGNNIPYLTARPRQCSIWRAEWAHYQSVTFVRARWKSWGGSVARGRAVAVYNMGSRVSISLRAYRLRWDCTRRYLIYTRVYVASKDGHGVVRPDTCTQSE